MGLNLDIRRIVFSTIEKFDGKQRRYLSVSEVKQIGGRAGRYGSMFPDGFVSAFRSEDIAFLKYSVDQNDPQIRAAGLLPRFFLGREFRSFHRSDTNCCRSLRNRRT